MEEWFQHEMDDHRWFWWCIFCDDENSLFPRREDICIHIQQQHAATITQNQLDLVLVACKRPTTRFVADSCPLCTQFQPPVAEVFNMEAFRDHLAKHQEQVSLAALPLHSDGLETEGDGRASSGHDAMYTDSVGVGQIKEAANGNNTLIQSKTETFEEYIERFGRSCLQKGGSYSQEGYGARER